MKKTVLRYKKENGTQPYKDWFASLKDGTTKTVVEDRIERARNGNYGDCEPIGDGSLELRINHGPGYRVYFGPVGEGLIVLLGGGNKNGQSGDIKAALGCWKEWKARNI